MLYTRVQKLKHVLNIYSFATYLYIIFTLSIHFVERIFKHDPHLLYIVTLIIEINIQFSIHL